MRITPRILIAGVTGVVMAVAMTALSAQGVPNDRTLAVDGSNERVRLDDNGSYQVSVDNGRNWSRSRPQASVVRLRNRAFDPTADPGALRAPDGNAYLVQFAGGPLDSQRGELTRLGARIGSYIPDFAYVVRMNEATRAKVAVLPYIRWVGGYDPADKYDPAAPAGRMAITMVERSAQDQSDVVDWIQASGATVLAVSASLRLVEANLTQAQVRGLAQLGAVLAIDPVGAPGTDMDKARTDGGANAIEAAGGYRGQGVRGEVMDSGLRVTHQEFTARPPIIHGGNSSDINHGTSTYGQIFARGVTGQARGMLPESQGIFASYDVSDRYAHTAQLVNPAGNFRAVFQSNSWGGELTTSYTAVSAALDDIVFDHDLLICQSQSNTGNRDSRPEAWAKNVVSVGAQNHYDTLARGDDRWNGTASIGPAADGRIKPDLSNYYDQIYTTAETSDTAYTNFGGTSGATPITCGNFGLLHQMWADGVFAGSVGQGRDVFNSRPHASTAKALMINQANSYAFTGESADLTRVHQGWGTASVGNLYAQAQAHSWRLPILVNETDLLQVGQKKTYNLTIDGSQPLKATMVYTDPQGSPTASVARVNDLSLKLTAPNGTVYWGNNGLKAGNWSTSGGVSNTIDTVENVLVQNPAPGNWTIEVIADEINSDGHVETAATDADFALVVTAKTGAALTVTSPGNQTSTVGTAIGALNHTASGGTAPYTWAATGLPPGLSVNTSTGQVTGTPAAAGTYAVTVTATDRSASAKTGSASYDWTVNPVTTPGCTQVNGIDIAIPDLSTVDSPVTVAGCAGNAGTSATVAVNIVHPYIGDLIVTLVAPDGSSYVLHNRTGGSADNINTTYTVNLSSEAANGTWKLRVQDAAASDTGTIDTWTLNLGGAAPTCTATNSTDVMIADNTTVNSPLTIAGCAGNGSPTAAVTVAIAHTYIGDLLVQLVAPDGTLYTLHDRTGGSAGNINQTYAVNLSAEVRNGTWQLRVNDNAAQDTGYIDSWTLTM